MYAKYEHDQFFTIEQLQFGNVRDLTSVEWECPYYASGFTKSRIYGSPHSRNKQCNTV